MLGSDISERKKKNENWEIWGIDFSRKILSNDIVLCKKWLNCKKEVSKYIIGLYSTKCMAMIDPIFRNKDEK